VNSVKDAFALKIDLTIKGKVSAKAREQCYKCKGYDHYDYQCPSGEQCSKCDEYGRVFTSALWRVDMLILYLGNDVDDVRVPSEISSIVEEPLVNPGARIIDESHVFCGY